MEEILLNRMYVGEYTKNKIGHEIINNFKDDNGNQYIYITKGVEKGHKNIKTVLLINNKFEILAKAEVEPLYNLNQTQKEIIEQKDIRYGNKLIYEILGYDDKAHYVTFKAKKIWKPKEKITFIFNRENNKISYSNGIEINLKLQYGQDNRRYLKEETEEYKKVKEIIDNKQLWNNKDENEKVNLDNYKENDKFNFIQLIGKENDEKTFTNMLRYFFASNKLEAFNEFAKSRLEISNDNFSNIEIEKAVKGVKDGFIDLFVEGDKNIVIIENKINSGLNGTDKEKGISQLSTYYRWAENEEKYKNKKITGLIFVPDRNKIELEKEMKEKDSLINKKYKIIKYSELYDFFFQRNKVNEQYYNYIYYKEFISALFSQKLTSKEKMELEFISAIKNTKSN